MRRTLYILEYALSSLWRRRKKNLALLTIYSLVVAFFASTLFFTSALREQSRLVIRPLPELWLQKLAGGRLVPISVSLADSLKNIRGIKNIQPRVWGYYYDSPTGAVFTVIGSDSLFKDLPLTPVSESTRADSSSALCGQGFLQSHGLDVGDQLTLIDNRGKLHGYTIRGAFTAATDLLTHDLIILPPAAARRVLGLRKNEATDIAIAVYNPDEADNIAVKISRRFPGIRVVSKRQLAITYNALFGWRGGIFIYGALISLLAFLILAWDRASGLSRQDQKELGILKGIGWDIGDVLALKFWEGFVISITATLSGVLLAIIHIFIFNALLIKPFLIGWSVLYPPYKIPLYITLGDVLLVLVISVVPYLTATLLPAWKGAVTDPAEVMQNG